MQSIIKSDIKKMTILLLLVSFCYALANGIPNVAINHIINAFSINGAQQGLIVSTISAGVMTAVIIAPSFQGRVNKIKMLLFSTLTVAASLFIQGTTKSLLIFYIFSFILGLGFGWIDGYMNSIMLDIHPNNSAVPMGLLHGFFGIGSLVFPIVATLVLGILVWNSLYYMCAIIMALLAICIIVLTYRVRSNDVQTAITEDKLKKADLMEYISNPTNALMLLIGICVGSIQTGVSAWIVRYMTLEFNKETLGATAISVMWIASTINRFIMPQIKIRPLKLIIYGLIIAAVVLVIGVAVNLSFVMVIAIGIFGFFTGHLIPMLLIEASKTHNGNTTMTTFLMQIALSFGRILIPIIMAYISDVFNVKVSMIIPAILCIVAVIAGMFINKYERKEKML